MAEYLSPAVYIEEPPSGIKPIQGISTSVAGFIGIAERGPLAEAVSITNYGQFVTTYGSPIDAGYLAFAVKSFFDEGGTSCYVVRVARSTTTAERSFPNAAATNVITVRASSPGLWGNSLTVGVVIPPAPDPTFTLTVSRAGSEIERLTGLTLNPLLSSYAPARVADLSSYITVLDLTTGAGPRPATIAPQALTGAVDGNTGFVTADFIGTEANHAGLHALDPIEDVSLVAVPETVPRDVHVQGMAYCERRMDCFYVAHVAEMAVTSLEVLGYKRAQGAYAGGNALNSKYGAL